MTGMRHNCPKHGTVIVDTKDILIFVEPGQRWADVYFPCAECGEKKLYRNRNVQLLGAALSTLSQRGACPRIIHLPPRGKPLPFPPVNFDDLIDFHFAVDAEIEHLLEGT